MLTGAPKQILQAAAAGVTAVVVSQTKKSGVRILHTNTHVITFSTAQDLT